MTLYSESLRAGAAFKAGRGAAAEDPPGRFRFNLASSCQCSLQCPGGPALSLSGQTGPEARRRAQEPGWATDSEAFNFEPESAVTGRAAAPRARVPGCCTASDGTSRNRRRLHGALHWHWLSLGLSCPEPSARPVPCVGLEPLSEAWDLGRPGRSQASLVTAE